MKRIVATFFLALVFAPGAVAQDKPTTLPRPMIEFDTIPPISSIQDFDARIDALFSYLELTCDRLRRAIELHETRTIPAQMWNRVLSALPMRDQRAYSGEYLELLRMATLEALRELLLVDAVTLTELVREGVDRATYLSWLRNPTNPLLDELSRRVAGSLGLRPGERMPDFRDKRWADLVRRKAAEHAETMRIDRRYSSPAGNLTFRRALAIFGAAKSAAAVGDYLVSVNQVWGPLWNAYGVAWRSEREVTRRAIELTAQMREGERMRLSHLMRCSDEQTPSVGALPTRSRVLAGEYKGLLGTLTFRADGTYVLAGAFGQRLMGSFKVEGDRVFLTNWQAGREQWFFVRPPCLNEPFIGAEMFCQDRAPSS
jgi:hypothetical protein